MPYKVVLRRNGSQVGMFGPFATQKLAVAQGQVLADDAARDVVVSVEPTRKKATTRKPRKPRKNPLGVGSQVKVISRPDVPLYARDFPLEGRTGVIGGRGRQGRWRVEFRDRARPSVWEFDPKHLADDGLAIPYNVRHLPEQLLPAERAERARKRKAGEPARAARRAAERVSQRSRQASHTALQQSVPPLSAWDKQTRPGSRAALSYAWGRYTLRRVSRGYAGGDTRPDAKGRLWQVMKNDAPVAWIGQPSKSAGKARDMVIWDMTPRTQRPNPVDVAAVVPSAGRRPTRRSQSRAPMLPLRRRNARRNHHLHNGQLVNVTGTNLYGTILGILPGTYDTYRVKLGGHAGIGVYTGGQLRPA